LAELARLDGLIGGAGNKPVASMANAVSQTEKIRDWVSTAAAAKFLINYILIKLNGLLRSSNALVTNYLNMTSRFI
jgi:hypothetical protein